MGNKTAIFLIALCLYGPTVIFAEESFWTERRQKDSDPEVSYFAYPLLYSIPGYSTGTGYGGSILNALGDGSTASIARLKGDDAEGTNSWNMDSLVLTEIPLFTEHFTLSAAYGSSEGGTMSLFDRGRDSPTEPAFNFTVDEGRMGGLEFSLNFFDKHLEIYSGYALGFFKPQGFSSSVATKDQFKEAYKNYLRYANLNSPILARTGIYWDDTDDRRDPQEGYRVQTERMTVEDPMGMLVESYTDDINFTYYFPNADKSSIFVFNVFYSTATVTSPLKVGEESYNSCVDRMSKKDRLKVSFTVEEICTYMQEAAQEFNDDGEGNIASGTALGGVNRLRSYPVGRFHDKHVFFTGLEHRWYLNRTSSPFDYFLAKGVFEAFQIATFYEIGQVSETLDRLFSDFKSSAGVGFRVILTGLVLRADYATGAERSEITAMFGYAF